jgi:amino acid adenylation domain-containing protein
MRLVHDLLDQRVARDPDTPAVRDRRRSLSARELQAAAGAAAHALVDRGVGRGDRVAVAVGNRVEAVVALFAASRLGAVFVALDPRAPASVREHVLHDCEPSAVVVDDRDLPGADDGPARRWTHLGCSELLACPEAPARDAPAIATDLACLIYTSGSTGRPKGVMCRHANVAFAVAAIARRLRLERASVVASVLPITFDYGLYQPLLAIHADASAVLGEGVDAGPGLLRFVRWAAADVVPLVPSMVQPLLALRRREPEPPPAVATFTSTGERLTAEQIDRLRDGFGGARVFSMYGLTECKRVSILTPEELDERPGSVGRPLDGTECVVVDPLTCRPLDDGEVGELVVRGPHVMAGYWRAPELTALRYRPWGPTQDAALFTGDLCRRDADGFLHFCGRTDDIVKLRGLRVSLVEIELATGSIPGVEQAVALPAGVEHPVTLVAVGELSAAAVRAGLGERIEDYKIPDRIEVLPSLPLTLHGKVDRGRVAERLVAGA